MDYCGPRGIPYSTFLDWDDLSQSAALAWQARERDRCGGCGQHRSDWLDDHGQELRQRPAEVVDVFCPACSDLEAARQARGDGERPGFHLAFSPLHPVDADAPGPRSP